jgi:hypothetical protein
MIMTSDMYSTTAKKVQWFRAHADMMRWVEEVELLEEEFRRLIRGLEKMATIWESLSSLPSAELKHRPTVAISSNATLPGYSAYAARKAAMYREMTEKERDRFKNAGGQWPAENESLSEHVPVLFCPPANPYGLQWTPVESIWTLLKIQHCAYLFG